jgi:hypothetical protein
MAQEKKYVLLLYAIQWTPQVTLEGSTYSIEQQNGSKGPNLEEEEDDDDDTLCDAASVLLISFHFIRMYDSIGVVSLL